METPKHDSKKRNMMRSEKSRSCRVRYTLSEFGCGCTLARHSVNAVQLQDVVSCAMNARIVTSRVNDRRY